MDKQSRKSLLIANIMQYMIMTTSFIITAIVAGLNDALPVWLITTLAMLFLLSTLFFVLGIYHLSQYICSDCKEAFKPKFWHWVTAYHFFMSRKLTCPKCGKKHLCKNDLFIKDTATPEEKPKPDKSKKNKSKKAE